MINRFQLAFNLLSNRDLRHYSMGQRGSVRVEVLAMRGTAEVGL